MPRSLLFFLLLLPLTGCAALESIPYTPAQTPTSWLLIQPYWELALGGQSFILVQPSTSTIVYLLGFLTIAFGVLILCRREDQRSRLWWGVALLLWGVGALLAGTSYEAFSYHIKCAGRPACIWTSGWEVVYLLFSVASLDAMLVAEAYSCASGKLRAALVIYALSNAGLYSLALLVGSLIPIQFLISFELLILVAAPGIVALLVLNARRYFKLKLRMDLALAGVWLGLGAVMAAYFIYYALGITQLLWAQGIWFSENDVLHIGLILWMMAVTRTVSRYVWDQPVLSER